MPWWRRGFRRQGDREADLERELRSHLDLEAEELREFGVSRHEALYAAQRALGNTTFIKQEVRTMWGWTSIDILLQDIRYGLRQLGRTPVFTVVAILTLALAIGANTAIFSAMNAILLRYLPVPDAQRLVYLSTPGRPDGAMQSGDGNTSIPERIFEELRTQRRAFSDLVAFVPLSFNRIPVRYGPIPEELQVDMVSGNFFSGLGVPAALGRTLSMDDERSHAPVAVLSHTWWARRFSRESSVLGQALYVKGVPITIVGVAAPDFTGVEHSPTDIWIPLQTTKALKPWGRDAEAPWSLYGSPNWWCLKTMGRLAAGVTAQQALAQLNPMFQRAAYSGLKPNPKARPIELSFIPARGLEGVDKQYRQPLAVLMTMVSLILVIACANVALLLVARNAARRREFGLRMALGGNRQRLFRQLLTESCLLVTAGGTLGWLFSLVATRALAIGWSLDFDLAPDSSVQLFTLAVSLSAALIFGLAPLRGVLRIPLGAALKSSSANPSQERTGMWGSRLAVGLQMCLCLVLLVGAGLLVRTLRNLETTNLGVRTSGLLVFGVNPQGLVHSDTDTHRFYRELLTRLRALSGIESATVMENRIGSGWSNNTGGFLVDGKKQEQANVYLRWNRVGPDYFQVLNIAVMLGREFRDSDSESAPKVAVVNQAFIARYLGDRGPLGHTIDIGSGYGPFTIVGVAANSKYTGVSEAPTPTAYLPYLQTQGGSAMHVELRTAGNPLAWLPAVRRTVAEMGPDLPLLEPMTQQEQFERSFSQERLFGRLAMLFGLLAALLVATGLYGTLAYTVSRRTSEVGVRMALGARRGQVLWMVVRGSLVVCLGSVIAGLPAAIASVRFLRSMLYGVEPGDPISFAGAVCGIVAVALVASLIPARRAASVDPMVALRHD